MSRLALLPIGLFVIWCVICQRWYVCHIKMACETETVAPVEPPAEVPDDRPLVFRWDDPTEMKRPSFEALKKRTLANLPEGKLLELVGLYFADETAPEGFQNMGLARAARIKSLFVPPLAAERVVETSRLVTDEPPGIRGDTLFEAVIFSQRDAPTGDEVEIIEVANTITILFPYGRAVREPDPRVNDYLETLAERLKQTEETVSITGHTDSSGSVDFNMRLGQARAKHIRDALVRKGIDKSRMTMNSKGESEPVASNETEEGSRQNRRVVLVLNEG